MSGQAGQGQSKDRYGTYLPTSKVAPTMIYQHNLGEYQEFKIHVEEHLRYSLCSHVNPLISCIRVQARGLIRKINVTEQLYNFPIDLTNRKDNVFN